MSEHIAVEHERGYHDNEEYARSCMFCDGGLFACRVCDSIEGATTTHCPGESMTADQVDAVYAGLLDFRDGEWIEQCSPHSPAFWSTPEGKALVAAEKGKRSR